MRRRLIVGVTGALGSALARETLRQLAGADVEVHLVVSESARVTSAHVLGKGGLTELAAASHVHSPSDLAAPLPAAHTVQAG